MDTEPRPLPDDEINFPPDDGNEAPDDHDYVPRPSSLPYVSAYGKTIDADYLLGFTLAGLGFTEKQVRECPSICTGRLT